MHQVKGFKEDKDNNDGVKFIALFTKEEHPYLYSEITMHIKITSVQKYKNLNRFKG